MIFDIKNYAEQLSKNVKINFSLYLEDGRQIFGNGDNGDNLTSNFTTATQDLASDRVLFKFKYHAVNYIGVISGNTEENLNYAVLLAELFENYVSKGTMLSKEDFFRSTLLGEIDENRIKKYLTKYNVNSDKSCVMLFTCSGKAEEALQIAVNYSESDVCFAVLLDNATFALVKYIEGNMIEYRSTSEYASLLYQLIYEETGIKVSIDIGGAVDSLVKLNTSLSQAEATKRMRGNMNIKEGVHSFKEFMLLHILEELPVNKLNDFYSLLTDISNNDIYADQEITQTAEEFLENSLNVSETARKLFLHRNTLIYRLDKIENETGLNIRNFADALTFRLIMLLKSLLR